ncbi:hypothetical protein GTY41_08055 [Streptomyces sp. SID685]|uniref:LysR substrate-binding domain-containing protein n=1 Tax=Streptomyces TaxID=1883 RepID=UPI00136AB1C4|nr:hypothetical protein [Streptomyces sp. SID685]
MPVRSGALDLGFLRDPSNLSAEIVSEAFAVERIAAALPHDHRLAGADVIDLAELRDEGEGSPRQFTRPNREGRLRRRSARSPPRRR